MNYTKQAATLCCTCCIVLFALSLLPPQKIFGVELKRVNILSDLITYTADEHHEEVALVIDDTEYEVDLEQVAQEVVALHESAPASQSSYTWSAEESHEVVDTIASQSATPISLHRLLADVDVVPIEDFDTTALSPLRRFYQKLLAPDSLVRIAVLGDSFIEADILTADLRESLQDRFGGCGCGFAPMASPLTQYRKTVKTTSKGWTSHNVMQRRTTPEPYSSLFSVGGWVSRPAAAASTKWSSSSERKYLDSCQRVKIHFVALEECCVEVSINSSEPRSFNIEGGEGLRQIELEQSDIRSVSLKVVSGQDGFVGYGALFEGRTGVTLDNYSVRSNNGQAMFWTSPSINAQIDKAIGGYDLVVLQYGLNIMQSGVNNYTRYAEQVEKMITYAQQCFPKAAIVVMSVSDRSFKKEGSYVPMSEAPKLAAFQREAAETMGVGFWSTYQAMQEQGGMSSFVSNGWAAKDFTHINFAGGRQVAWAMVDAIVDGVNLERTLMVKKAEYDPIIDSLRDSELQQQFMNHEL
ncbi:MAG: hypothetical protein R3Y08_03875 [Rikenellaceae bacterium]